MRIGFKDLQAAAPSFWLRVADADERGCMEWTGARDQDGYGRLQIAGRQERAHRIAFALSNAVAPAGLMVCHTCDNPACCNPAHLWLGTNRDNQVDSVVKGRHPRVGHAGQDNGRAKLTEDQVAEAIGLIAAGKTNVEIAAAFGVGHATISAIRRRKSWPSLPRPDNDNFLRYASSRRACP